MAATGWGNMLPLPPDEFWAKFEEDLQQGYKFDQYSITDIGRGQRVISTYGSKTRHLEAQYDPYTGLAFVGGSRATQEVVPTFGGDTLESSLHGALAGIVGRMYETPDLDLSKSLDPYAYQRSNIAPSLGAWGWTGGAIVPENIAFRRAQRLLPSAYADPTHVSPWHFLQQAGAFPRAVPTVSGLLRQAQGLHTGAMVTDVGAFDIFPGMESVETAPGEWAIKSTYPGQKPREKMMGNLSTQRTFHIMPTGGAGEDIMSSKLRGATPLFDPLGKEIPGLPGVLRQVEFIPSMLIPGAGQSYAQSSAFKDLELMQLKSQGQPLDYGMMRQFGEQVQGSSPLVTLASRRGRLGTQDPYLNVLGQEVGLEKAQQLGTLGYEGHDPILKLGYGPETGSLLRQYAPGIINDLRGQGYNVDILNVAPITNAQTLEYTGVIQEMERKGVGEKLVGPGIELRFRPGLEKGAELEFGAQIFSPWTGAHSLGLQAAKTVPSMMEDLTTMGADPQTALVMGGESIKGAAYLVDLLANTLTPKQWAHFGLTPGTFDEQGIMRWGAGENVMETVRTMFNPANEATLASMLESQGGGLSWKWIKPSQDPSITGMFRPGGDMHKYTTDVMGRQGMFQWRGEELWQQAQVITGGQILSPTEAPQRERQGKLNLQDILNAARKQPGAAAAFYNNVSGQMPYAQTYMAAFGVVPETAEVIDVEPGGQFGLPFAEARALAHKGLEGPLGDRYAPGSLEVPPLEYVIRAMAQSELFAGKFTKFTGTGPQDPSVMWPPPETMIADIESGGTQHFGLTGEPISALAHKMGNFVSELMGGTTGMPTARREFRETIQEFATQPGVIKGAATGTGFNASVSGRLSYVGDLGLAQNELGLVVSDDVHSRMQNELANMGMNPTNENMVARFMRHPGGVISGAEHLIGKVFSASEAAEIAKSRGGSAIDPTMFRGVGITSGGVASMNAYDVDKDIGLAVATVATAFPGLTLDNDLQKTFIEGARQVYPDALIKTQNAFADMGVQMDIENLPIAQVLSHAGKGAGQFGKALEAVDPAIAYRGGLNQFVMDKFGENLANTTTSINPVTGKQEQVAMSALGKQMIGMSNNFAALMSFALDKDYVPATEGTLSKMGLIKQSLVDTEGLATESAKELTTFNALSRAAGSLFLPMTPNMWARSSNRSSDITVSIFGQFEERGDRMFAKRVPIMESELLTAWAPGAMKYGGLNADDIIGMLGGPDKAAPVTEYLRGLERGESPASPFAGADRQDAFRDWFRSTPLGGTVVYGQAGFKAMNYALEVEGKIARGEPVQDWMAKRATAVRAGIESGEWDKEIESFMLAQATLGPGQNARLVRDQAVEFGGLKQFRYGGDLIAALSRQVETGTGTARDIVAATPLGALKAPFEKPSDYMLDRQRVMPGIDPQKVQDALDSGIEINASDIGKDLTQLVVNKLLKGTTNKWSEQGEQFESALYAMRPDWENEGSIANRNKEATLTGDIGGIQVRARKDLWKFLNDAKTAIELEDAKSGSPDFWNVWQLRAYKMLQEAKGITVEQMGFRGPSDEGRAALRAGHPTKAARSALAEPLTIVEGDDEGTIKMVHKTVRLEYQAREIIEKVRAITEEQFASGRTRPGDDDLASWNKLTEDILNNIMGIETPNRQAVSNIPAGHKGVADPRRLRSRKGEPLFGGRQFANAVAQGFTPRHVDYSETLGPIKVALAGQKIEFEHIQQWIASGAGMQTARLSELSAFQKSQTGEPMSGGLRSGLETYVKGLNREMPEQASIREELTGLITTGQGLSETEQAMVNQTAARMNAFRSGTVAEPLGPGVELTTKNLQEFGEEVAKITESTKTWQKGLDDSSKALHDITGKPVKEIRAEPGYATSYSAVGQQRLRAVEGQAAYASAVQMMGPEAFGGGGDDGSGMGLRERFAGGVAGARKDLGARFGPGKKAATFYDIMYAQRVAGIAWGGMQKAGQEAATMDFGIGMQAEAMGAGSGIMPTEGVMAGIGRADRARREQGRAFNQAWGGVAGGGVSRAAGPLPAIAGPAIGAALIASYFLPSVALAGPVAAVAAAAIGTAGYVATQAREPEEAAAEMARGELEDDDISRIWGKIRTYAGAAVASGGRGYDPVFLAEQEERKGRMIAAGEDRYSNVSLSAMTPGERQATLTNQYESAATRMGLKREQTDPIISSMRAMNPLGVSEDVQDWAIRAGAKGLDVSRAQQAYSIQQGRPFEPGQQVSWTLQQAAGTSGSNMGAFLQFGGAPSVAMQRMGQGGLSYSMMPDDWTAGNAANWGGAQGSSDSLFAQGAIDEEEWMASLMDQDQQRASPIEGDVSPSMRHFTARETATSSRVAGMYSSMASQGQGFIAKRLATPYGGMGQAQFEQAYAGQLKAWTTSPVSRSRMAMQMGDTGGGTISSQMQQYVTHDAGGYAVGYRSFEGSPMRVFGSGQQLAMGNVGPSGVQGGEWTTSASAWGDAFQRGGVDPEGDLYKAGMEGVEDPLTGDTVGGMRGVQIEYGKRSRENAMAGIGIQAQQLALKRKYMTGEGMPGGRGFWQIQDDMTALSRRQQDYGWESQGRQMQMQQSQFFEGQGAAIQQAGVQAGWKREDFATQAGQTQIQRQWSREDWQMSDQQRGLQWGWQMEDMEENIRMTTGRTRRKAVQGRERATTMHNLQEEQIDTQRERQEEQESWQDEAFQKAQERFEQGVEWQDEAFDRTRRNFMESMNLQQRDHRKSMEFMLERRKLEDEQTKMQREFTLKQMDLQQRALGVQAAQIKLSQEYQVIADTERANQKEREAEALEALDTQLTRALNRIIDMGNRIEHWKMPRGGGPPDPDDPVTVVEQKEETSVTCFVAGTLVTMSDLTYKVIEDIRVGDMVMSFTEDDVIEPNEVLWVKPPNSRGDMVHLHGDDFTIRVSSNHRFWTPDGWVEAQDIQDGDLIKTYRDGEVFETMVLFVNTSSEEVEVYNFHVENNPTYIADDAMVHNWKQFGGRVRAMAFGGGVDPRAGIWVGEAGPELFQPDRPGTIIPSANTSSMIGVALNAGDSSSGGHPLGGAIGQALGNIGNARDAVVVLQALQELVETVDNVDPNAVKRVGVLLDTIR
jgi:hypothetical protein